MLISIRFTNLFYLLLLAGFISIYAQDTDADSTGIIIGKHVEALGGAERWKAVKSMKISGNYESFSIDKPFTLYRMRPHYYLFDHFLNGQPVKQYFNGRHTWQVNPLYGSDAPMLIPNGDSLVVRRDALIESVFIDYDAKGHSVRYQGKADIDGHPTYHLEVMLADSSVENWYISQESLLAVKMQGKSFDFGRPVGLEAYFEDYRTIEGCTIPFHIELEFGTRYRVYQFDSVELNSELEETMFTIPAALLEKPVDGEE